MPELIASAANPLVKRVRLLGERRYRRREGAFVVRGVQPVWQAVEAGAEIEVLITAPELLREPAASMVAAQERAGVRVARLTAGLFGRIADRDGPAGLAAIVRQRSASLRELRIGPGSVVVALHEAGNPGNIGTIIRTAAAAGAAGVVLIGATADPYDPVAVKASMGAIFSVPVVAVAGAGEFLGWARENGVAVAVTSANGAGTVWERRLPSPLALLLGSEGAGLPPELLAAGDLRLRIPMTGTAESLNLAIATGVLLYEVWRQRDGGPLSGDSGTSGTGGPD